MVSTRIKMVCAKVQESVGTHTIDVTLLNEDEEKFIEQLEELITIRITQLINSADEMIRVNY